MKKTFINKITRIVATAIGAIMCLTFAPVSAFADEVDEPISPAYESTYTMITPYAMDEPTTLGQLPYTATIESLSATYFTRTAKYFTTSTQRLVLDYELKATRPTGSATERTLVFRLYYCPKSVTNKTWILSETKSVSFYNAVKSQVIFTGLSSSNWYYLDFYNTSSPSSDWGVYNALDGTVKISS